MFVTSPLYSLRAWRTMSSVATSQLYNVEGSCVFRRMGMRTILNRYYVPTNPRTELQQSWRGGFSSAVASWGALSADDKQSWNEYQDKRRRRPVMSGYNLYISKFLLSNGNPLIPPDGRASAR